MTAAQKTDKYSYMSLNESGAKGRPRVLKYAVDILEARPNPLFTEQQRALVRFLRFYELGKPARVACAHCGKKKTILWTQLCSFRVADDIGLVLAKGEKVYPPLTAVCQAHILAPETMEVPAP